MTTPTPDEIRELIASLKRIPIIFHDGKMGSKCFPMEAADLLERYLLSMLVMLDDDWMSLEKAHGTFIVVLGDKSRDSVQLSEDLGDALTKAMNAMQDKEDS